MTFWRRKRQDLDEELQTHLALLVEQNVERGMSPEAARRAAKLSLGGADQIKESVHDHRALPWLDALAQDLRFALRMLRKSPGFTAVAVLTLALGIGANTAIFSFTYRVLLRSLPVPNPQQLVVLRSPGPHHGHTWSDIDGGAQSFSYPMYKVLRDRSTVFAGLMACRDAYVNVAGRGTTQTADGELVSGNYFETLEVQPALGRMFTAGDETASGANPVAVLSYAYWTRQFGADPTILNKSLTVNGIPLTVVGVARKGFDGVEVGYQPDIFIPVTMKAQMAPNALQALEDPNDYWLPLMGRLKPGMTLPRAQAELQPIYAPILEENAKLLKLSGRDLDQYVSKPLLLAGGSQGREVLQSALQAPLWVLMGMVGLVLLIACANLASLLVARGEARQREIAVRMALGAGRARLVRQLLTEGLLIAIAGGAAGVALASWSLDAMVGSIPANAGMSGLAVAYNPAMLWFAMGATLATSLLFGLAPALRSTRVNLQGTLKDQGSSVSEGRSTIRLRKVLIVSQVAITAVLLATAGLLARTLANLEHAKLGVRTDHVLQFSVSPDLNGYTPARAQAFADSARRQLAALPGVRSASVSSIPIFADDDASFNITPEGCPLRSGEDADVLYTYIGPDYFSTLGIPLLAGREFSGADTAKSPKVVIINEKLAQLYFAGKNPIGMRIARGAGYNVHPDMEIVGVVADSKWEGPRSDIVPFLYLPYSQDANFGGMTFYVLAGRDPAQQAAAVRGVMGRLDANLPLNKLRPLTAQVDESMFSDKLVALLSLSLAALAALLAALGLYGVLAYVVARRTREIGIRIALGGQRADILRLVLGQGAQLAPIGGAIGIAAAFGVTQLAATLFYGVSPRDPLTFLGVALLLAIVALLACYIPARRAMRVDPMVALRYE